MVKIFTFYLLIFKKELYYFALHADNAHSDRENKIQFKVIANYYLTGSKSYEF